MGIFGWDYPPGCSGTPYDETHATDLSALVSFEMDEPCAAFWDEDGGLWGCRRRELADSECEVPLIGELEWDDDLEAHQNFNAAAAAICRLLKETP